ncbi:hypothetical protein K439DRAFT_1626042 [Ramaria rubella]|nr:hypothetical protein K439DRAFT_1626042 [Ramaria rubella]
MGIESDGTSGQNKKMKPSPAALAVAGDELTFSSLDSDSEPKLVLPWQQEAASTPLFLPDTEDDSGMGNGVAGPSTHQTRSHVQSPTPNLGPVPGQEASNWIQAESFPVAKSTLNFQKNFGWSSPPRAETDPWV